MLDNISKINYLCDFKEVWGISIIVQFARDPFFFPTWEILILVSGIFI